MMTRDELLQVLRAELPQMLKDDPMFRAQVIGVLSEVLITKAEFTQMLDELRAMRIKSERRFDGVNERLEAYDQRFDAIDRRFDGVESELGGVQSRLDGVESELGGVQTELGGVKSQLDGVETRLAEVEVGQGSLELCAGRGLEDVIRQAIEGYSGISPLQAQKLTLIDETGEFRQPGAVVEFDALVTNGRKFLVEVKNYAKSDDVWAFYEKARFAETKLGERFELVSIAPAATRSAVKVADQLGIHCHTSSIRD